MEKSSIVINYETENQKKKIDFKEEWKIAVIATWIVGLLAHAYRFFNFLPVWDSMYNFKGTGSTYESGRWFLEFVGKFSTEYDMPWVNGALSLFYLSIVVVLLIELLEIKGKAAIILTAALVAAFPTVTSSFAYMFTADGYMLAFLLSVAGIFLTEKYRLGFLPGMVCICLSISTYQAYLSTALMVVWIICIKKLLIDEKKIVEVVQIEYKQVIAVVGGFILNRILTTVVNDYVGISLISYQGINEMKLLSFKECIENIHLVQLYFGWFLQIGVQKEDNWYSHLNTIIILAIMVLSIWHTYKKKLYKRPLELISLLFGYWCTPILVFIISFVSKDVSYHTLMIMSIVFVYLLLLLLIVEMKSGKRIEQVMKGAAVLGLCGICYYNILNANYAYFSMNLSYEKAYTISQDILERIEETEGFNGTQPIAIIGYYAGDTWEVIPTVTEMAGIYDTNFLWDTAHYLSMWRYCMGRYYGEASAEAIEMIKQTEAYQQMGVYPYANAVKIIDGVVVVKLPPS